MRIGYILRNYPEKRCIINRTENTYVYFNLKKSFTYIVKSVFRRLGFYSAWDVYAYLNVSSGNVDVWHTFNEIVRTDKPFVITFESAVPRNSETLERKWERGGTYEGNYSAKTGRQIQCLCQNNCKRLLALSQNAADIMRYQLEMLKVGTDVIATIMDKVEVLYPPQTVNCTLQELRNKYRPSKKIAFVFVGNDFFRKGGAILLDVLKKFSDKKFHLTIVSSFVADSVFGYSEDERKKVAEFVQNQSWITYLQNIPNEQVLEILKKAQVGFLPTIQDTFGYSVLEMQASGCPVVTTDIRALSEINNDDMGWIISIKKHDVSKEAFYYDKNELAKAKQQIEIRLFDIIKEMIEKWEQGEVGYFENKALNCLDHISIYNNPIQYGERLSEIYQSAIH